MCSPTNRGPLAPGYCCDDRGVNKRLPPSHFWCTIGIVMSTIANVITAEQLFATNLQHCELIGGEIVMMSPAGFDHGRFASRIVTALENQRKRS
jgi:hypothetical protein